MAAGLASGLPATGRPSRRAKSGGAASGRSSFAVIGNRLFTQEQRGDEEFVICYDAVSGQEIWLHGDKGLSYCSLHLARLSDVEQLVMTSDSGLTSYEPASGKILWQYEWPIEGMARVTQPALLDNSDVLNGTGFGNGTLRVHVAHGKNGWTTEEVWSTKAIKPYFNDLVVHEVGCTFATAKKRPATSSANRNGDRLGLGLFGFLPRFANQAEPAVNRAG